MKGASPVKNNDAGFTVPFVENIHQKVLAAVSKDNSLEMASWHTCETTHCRGGWVEIIAGPEGAELARRTTTLFAAMQIYHKSCPQIPVSPTRFFETNTLAMMDIKRCAEEEIRLNAEAH